MKNHWVFANPFRYIGILLSSPMATGAAVGFLAGVAGGVVRSLVLSGLVALVAWVLSVVYQVVDARLEVTRGHGTAPSQDQVAAEVVKLLKEKGKIQ